MRKIKHLLFVLVVTMMPTAMWADNVAKIGETEYATLQAAVDAATDGQTITLLKSFTLTTVSTTVEGEENTNYDVLIDKSITIDGAGYTVTAKNGKRAFAFTGDDTNVLLKNLTIKSNSTKNGSFWLIANNLTVTIDNVTIDGTSNKTYNQVVTIGQNYENVTFNVTNGSTIKTNDAATAHYAIILWSPATVNITNSTIKGWANVYVKNTGAGATVNVTSSNLYSQGLTGATNDFAMFVTEGAANITVTDCNIDLKASTAANNTTYQGFFSPLSSGTTLTVGGDNTTVTTNANESNYVTAITPAGVGNLDPAYNNSVVLTPDTQDDFAQLFENSEVELTIDNETGNYVTDYVAEVYYWWYSGEDIAGTKCSFVDPFIYGWYSPDETIELQKNVTLTSDVTCNLASGANANLLFKGYTVTHGAYHVLLNAGVSINTDAQTDLFAGATTNTVIDETVNGANDYTYTARLAAVDATIGANGMATFCAPIDVVFGPEVAAYVASAGTDDLEDNQIRMNRVLAAKAGEGVLLVGDAGNYSFNASAVAVSEVTGNLLKGVLAETTVSATDGVNTNFYLTNSGESATGVGFYLVPTAGKTIPAGKAYLQLTTTDAERLGDATGAKGLTLVFGDATGIKTIDSIATDTKAVYDLQGRRVAVPTRGLYIVNGKKVAIK